MYCSGSVGVVVGHHVRCCQELGQGVQQKRAETPDSSAHQEATAHGADQRPVDHRRARRDAALGGAPRRGRLPLQLPRRWLRQGATEGKVKVADRDGLPADGRRAGAGLYPGLPERPAVGREHRGRAARAGRPPASPRPRRGAREAHPRHHPPDGAARAAAALPGGAIRRAIDRGARGGHPQLLVRLEAGRRRPGESSCPAGAGGPPVDADQRRGPAGGAAQVDGPAGDPRCWSPAAAVASWPCSSRPWPRASPAR